MSIFNLAVILMGFSVLEPGFCCTIQDLGRRGYQHQGVTQGGAIDEYSFRWANRLVGNPDGAAALEITLGGLVLEAQREGEFAITGADLGARINAVEIEAWRNYRVRAGDRISFNTPQTGLRAYLAVAGGILSPVMLGSRCVVMREQIGGLNNRGEMLKAGDYLPYETIKPYLQREVALCDIPNFEAELELGVILGYQHRQFTQLDTQRFFNSEYCLTAHVDRMGYRLDGPTLKPQTSGIISEGITLGAIQVPADGKPIILMSDRQTIGGYPKLGSVFSLDLYQLAQRGPGAKIRFVPKDIAIAQVQRTLFQRDLKYFRF